jgi:molecular chaperone DnaK
VSAKDKKTGKEQRIEIKGNSGLSEDEIAQMVRDAEAHREDDKKFHELVTARNAADGLIHATRTAITEHGAKVPEQIGAIESALGELETAMKGDDKGQIEAKTNALQQAAQALYAAAAQAGQPGAGEAGGNAGGGAAGDSSDDVVDAEFTEVKDGK